MTEPTEIGPVLSAAYVGAITTMSFLLIGAIVGPANLDWIWAVAVAVASIVTVVSFIFLAFHRNRRKDAKATSTEARIIPI